MSFPSSTRVLIVGAGPTGMACALSLWYSGVKDVTIVEAVAEGNGNLASRAMAIHAATSEALDIVGVADAIVERGIKTSSIDYYDRKDRLLMTADFNGLIGKTRFPFFVLPQNMTEEILNRKLEEVGIPVFRSYKLVDMHENPNDNRLVDVSFENGQSITAAYVVGADGAQSAVRQSCGIKFADPHTPNKPEEVNTLAQMVVADITFDKDPKVPGVFYAVVSKESFWALVHLQYPMDGSKDSGGKTVHRMSCGVPLSDGAPPSKSSVEYCQELIEKYGPPSLSSDKRRNPNASKVDSVVWSTRFRTRYAAADHFFTHFGSNTDEASATGARVCLIGDAAHIHPPAGGQGMNLGLRDAVSLGPVLAAALTDGPSSETDERVRTHMALRRHRAVKVIGVAKFMAGAVGMAPVIRSRWSWTPVDIYVVRDWVIWALGKSKWFRQTVAYKFSGLEEP